MRAEWYGPVVVTSWSPAAGGDRVVAVGAEGHDDLVGPDREQLGVVDHDVTIRPQWRP